MIVAIPNLNNLVAPCFEAAKEFKIIKIDNGRLIRSKTVLCLSEEGFNRVRLLHLHDVDFVICNGIKSFYRDQLMAIGIKIIANVNDTVDRATESFITNKLEVYTGEHDLTQIKYEIDLNDLISWAGELFKSNGYSVTGCPGDNAFLIDLVAEIDCPNCGRKIRVAICCGGHTYKAEQEIKEFYHMAKTEYNARVFVYPQDKEIAAKCGEYGICLISPENTYLAEAAVAGKMVPILSGRIEGHENLSNTNENNET